MEAIKFNADGKEYTFNSEFLNKDNEESIKSIKNISDFKDLYNNLNKIYNEVDAEKACYYLSNMTFPYYSTSTDNDGTRCFNFFGDNTDENKNKLKNISNCINICAKKSKNWFYNLVSNLFAGDNSYDDSASYLSSGSLLDYFWYKHKIDNKDNPISLSIFLYKNYKFRVAIELHDSQSKKSNIESLYKDKFSKIGKIINEPKKYDISDEMAQNIKENLKFAYPDDKEPKIEENPGKNVTDNLNGIDWNKRIQLFFADVSIYDEKNNCKDVESLKNDIWGQIKILQPLYEIIATNSVYEREIYKTIYARDMKQIVFNGAPGTGKTFGVKKYVETITDYDEKRWKIIQFHPSYDYTDFVEGIRPVSTGGNDMSFVKVDGEFKRFCREIVEERLNACTEMYKKIVNKDCTGQESTNQEGDAGKEAPDAGKDDENKKITNKEILSEIIKIHKKRKKQEELLDDEEKILNTFSGIDDENEKLYYFIIDEINRADISKVFGELMYSLEYRGIQNALPTQYSQLNVTYKKSEHGNLYEPIVDDCFENGFFIPENIVIIGTMNDIDKSVESFDFAMRRRFQWIPIKAKDVMQNVLEGVFEHQRDDKKYNDNIKKLVDNINAMNELIVRHGKNYGLTEDYQIGPSYFKKFDITCTDFETEFKKHFDITVTPTLIEYIRGRADSKMIKEFVKKCNPLQKNNNQGEN